MGNERVRADLVLEGGGVKGIALVGAVARLTRERDFPRVAGSSAGSIVGAMVAAGLAPDDLRKELFTFPFERVPRLDLLDHVPLLGPALSVGFKRGLYDTRFLHRYLTERLDHYGIRTFRDLRMDDDGASLPESRRYRLIVTATDVTAGELLYLPWDYARFGLDADEQPVADAIVASCAIPFYFEPRYLRNELTGDTHVLVDGGTLSNFPITVFDRTDGRSPRWPTFGLKLEPPQPRDRGTLPLIGRLRIPGITHLSNLVSTLVVGRDQTYLAQPCVAARTMFIDTSQVSAIEFSLSEAEKEQLYTNGFNAADAFLRTWDWDAYRARCRGSTPVTAERPEPAPESVAG